MDPKEFIAGSVGGIVQVLTGQPFDTIKVRLQTSTQNSSMLDLIHQTYSKEGIKGFYKGTLTPLIGVGACVSIQFGSLETMKRFFTSRNTKTGSSNPSQLSNQQLYLSGAASGKFHSSILKGVANSILSGPIEHIRTRLQVQTGISQGPFDFIKTSVKQYGWRSLFKGQTITLIREFHGYGVYFATYEYIVQRSMRNNDGSIKPRNQVSSIHQVGAGAMAGILLWLCIYPIDAIKSNIQTDSLDPLKRQYNGILDCVKQTYGVNGIGGFFRGFWPCIIRAAPVNAATFLAYEMSMNVIARK